MTPVAPPISVGVRRALSITLWPLRNFMRMSRDDPYDRFLSCSPVFDYRFRSITPSADVTALSCIIDRIGPERGRWTSRLCQHSWLKFDSDIFQITLSRD